MHYLQDNIEFGNNNHEEIKISTFKESDKFKRREVLILH